MQNTVGCSSLKCLTSITAGNELSMLVVPSGGQSLAETETYLAGHGLVDVRSHAHITECDGLFTEVQD